MAGYSDTLRRSETRSSGELADCVIRPELPKEATSCRGATQDSTRGLLQPGSHKSGGPIAQHANWHSQITMLKASTLDKALQWLAETLRSSYDLDAQPEKAIGRPNAFAGEGAEIGRSHPKRESALC
jgi:hypothetical protein